MVSDLNRAGIALAIVKWLVILVILESALSFFFSLLTGKEVHFPLFTWLQLLGFTFIKLLLQGLHLLGSWMAVPFGVISAGTAVAELFDLLYMMFALPVAFFYPALVVFDSLLVFLNWPFFVLLMYDAIITGGPPAIIDPLAPNIMYFVYNLGSVETVITYLGAALTALGYNARNLAEIWVSYTSLPRPERENVWTKYRSLREKRG